MSKITVAYSFDLRTRAVDLINSGKRVEEIAELLKISKATLYNWLARNKKGNLKPKVNWQKGHSHKITDLDKFREFVDANKDCTLNELAEKWSNVKKSTIDRALRKIGYTKKKDLWVF